MHRLAPVLTVLVLALAATPTGGRQQEELSLAIRRDFGFRSGDRIQGRFTLEASGPADLARVELLLDQAAPGAGGGAVGVLLPGLVGRGRRILRRQDTGMARSAPNSGSEDEEQRLRRSIEDSKYLEEDGQERGIPS